jgi:hypothetical protein
MAISAASVTSRVIKIKSPSGTYYEASSVVYTSSSGQATFKFSRTFSSSDNGTWPAYTSDTNKVLDAAGNAVVADAKLGDFTVNIPTTADATAPTATLVSITPTAITTAGNVDVSIVVSFADA